MASFVEKVQFREVVVDFFGSLVPGALFLAGATLALGWPAALVISATEEPRFGEFVESISHLFDVRAGGLGLELHFLLLIAAYVLGYFFFRQDPKLPDRKSWLLISREFDKKSRENWVCTHYASCQYPYGNLRHYLQNRKLDYLANMVEWKEARAGDPQDDSDGRTKNFINVFKTRLLFHFPERYAPIARGEAQIRLMSSSWYCARLLVFISLSGLLVGCYWFWMAWNAPDSRTAWYSLLLLSTIAVATYAFNRTPFYAVWLDKKMGGWCRRGAGRWAKRMLTLVVPRLCRKYVIATLYLASTYALIGLWSSYDVLKYTTPIVLSYGVLCVALYGLSTIECFLHYQRVREIVMVLETAHQAFYQSKATLGIGTPSDDASPSTEDAGRPSHVTPTAAER